MDGAATQRQSAAAACEPISRHQLVLLVQQQQAAQGILDLAAQHAQQLDAELLMACFAELLRHRASAKKLSGTHAGTASLLSACQTAPVTSAQALTIAPAAAALKLQLSPSLLDRFMVLAGEDKPAVWSAVRGLGAFAALDARPSSLHLDALLLQTVARAQGDARMQRAALERVIRHSRRPDLMLLAGAHSQAAARRADISSLLTHRAWSLYQCLMALRSRPLSQWSMLSGSACQQTLACLRLQVAGWP